MMVPNIKLYMCGMQVGMGFPESLKGVEAGYVSLQPVPVTDGPRIKCELVCIVFV